MGILEGMAVSIQGTLLWNPDVWLLGNMKPIPHNNLSTRNTNFIDEEPG